MPVYVDNAVHHYGAMLMCHMLADTSEELLAMAEKIGVHRRWIQGAGTYREHFDVCKSKRKLAVENGAKEISTREVAAIIRQRRNGNA